MIFFMIKRIYDDISSFFHPREVLIIYDRVCGGRVNELALDKFANPLDHTIDNIKTRLKDGNAADWGVSCTY